MKRPGDAAVSLARWCKRQNWDALLMLFVGQGATAAQTDGHFGQLMDEIERSVGTTAFRWFRLVPRNEGEAPAAFFVLVGGASSDDLSSWGHRWSVISGSPNGRRGPVFSSGQRSRRMRSMLRTLLDDAQGFDIEVRVGRRRGRSESPNNA